jgi:hypothetical protein
MLRQRLPLMFSAVSALSVLAAHAEDRLLLKSVNVDLPVGDRMFEGPGSDVANNNCLACHSAGMVLFQPALWQALMILRMLFTFSRQREFARPRTLTQFWMGDVHALGSY